MKVWLFFESKSLVRNVVVFSVLATVCNVWLHRNSSILTRLFCLAICVIRFYWSLWRKSSLIQMRSWKKEEYFYYTFIQSWVLFFDVIPELYTGKFLMISFSVGSETWSLNFIFSVRLKAIVSWALSGFYLCLIL